MKSRKKEPRRSPDKLLAAAAELFAQRNKEYGEGYNRYGDLLVALFPKSGIPPIKDSRDAIRLNLIMMCLAKLQRYANCFRRGGHEDSAKDLQVYAAMLEENTKK